MTDYSYLSQLNDEELWRLTVSGDARAEEELYLVGSPKMFSMAAKNKKVSRRYTGLKHLMR